MDSFLIRLRTEGEGAAEALEAALDGGCVQDAVVDCAPEGKLAVEAATVVHGPRSLTADEVKVRVEPLEELERVRGHFASGEPHLDRALEEEILTRLERCDQWAWCCVKVTASWNGMEGATFLGCCSYEDEEEFRKDGCYGDMVEEALSILNAKVRVLWDQIAPLFD